MEHIHNIEIKNFKSIRHAVIDGCKRVNVFVGPPNVGKSNILEALSVLQFAAKREHDLDFHDFCRYEKEPEIFFEANTKEQTFVGCNSSVSIDMEIDAKNVVHFAPVVSIDKKLHGYQTAIKQKLEETAELNVLKYQFKGVPKKEGSKAWPFRNLQSPFGDNLFEVVSNDVELRKMFNDYLKQNGIRLLVDKTENSLKLLKDLNEDSFFQLPYSMMADTLQRLFFYKTAILTNKRAVLLFEEPESHLYEPYILDITNAIKYDKNNNQYFIVTHNQYFIDELLRDEESRNETSIYMVGLEKGGTAIRILKQQENEDVFSYGLNVFFNYEDLWKQNA